MQLSRVIFWDTDYNSINWEKNARYVIERVLMYGTLNDWGQIKQKYGPDRILREMLQSNNLDAKAISFLSTIFNITQTKFRCYSIIQSTQGHWSY
jgi:hypothetical protein